FLLFLRYLRLSSILSFPNDALPISAVIRNQAYLHDIEIEIKEWYREYVKPHEDYQAYLQIEDPTLEEDNAILQEILKKIVFKTRSEEHTSELQSRENLVCSLLLEKE